MKNTMIHNLVKHLPGLKHIKSEFYRGFVLYTFLFTLGVGQMWATTWTVAGSNAAIINGTSTWCADCSANDMTNVSGNYWALEISGKNPSASSYTFKICKDHSWTTAYPASDYAFNNIATGSGTTILYTFNASTHAINAYGFKTWRVVGTTAATGYNWSTTATSNNMSKGSNVYTYTLTKNNMSLVSGTTYEFKVIKDGAYTVSFPAENKTFTVPTTGKYNITYTIDLSTQTVSVNATLVASTITLNKNGGSANGSAKGLYQTGTTLINLNAPTRAGYKVVGYYKEAGCTNLIADAAGNLQASTDYTNSSKQWNTTTASVTLYAKWEEDLSSNCYLKGGFDSWGDGVNMTKKTGESTGTVVYCTRDFTASNSPTPIKITEGSTWYGAENADNSMTKKTGSSFTNIWTLATPGNDIHFYPSITGTYTFKYDYSDHKLQVYYPVVYQLQVFSASPTDATNTNNFDWDSHVGNVYRKTLSLNANTTYEFKCVVYSDFYGNVGEMTAADHSNWDMSLDVANCRITTQVAGDYEFAFTYTGSGVGDTKRLTVTYPTAYTITYGAGTNNGSSTAISVSPSFASGDYVAAATAVTFSKGSTKAGYTWKGWYSNADGTGTLHSSTDGSWTSAASTRTGNISVYACYTLKTYTATLSTTGKTGYGSGAPANQTVTYMRAMPTITPPAAANGYCFMGYWDGAEGTGTKYYNANGTSAHAWDKTSSTTLHAYFKKAEIVDLDIDPSLAEKGGTVKVTPEIDPKPAGTTSVCYYLLYMNGNKVDPQPDFGNPNSSGLVSFTAPNVAGTFILAAALRTGSSCGGGTLLDSVATHTFQVGGEYNVTIKYMCGTTVIKEQTRQGANPVEYTSISAPDIFGYTFSTWEIGDGITKHPSDALTKKDDFRFTASYDGTITAIYTKKSIFYFKNTLGWSNVYVNFMSNQYWDALKGSGNKNNYYSRNNAMSLVPGTTDIYYIEYTGSTSEYITFTSKSQDNAENFWGKNPNVQVVVPTRPNNDGSPQTDFGYHAGTNMFVPLNTKVITKNTGDGGGADYYNRGYWLVYDPITGYTGYTLEVYNKTNDDGGRYIVKEIPFTINSDGLLEAVVDLEAKTGYGIKFRRDDGMRYTNVSQTLTNDTERKFEYHPDNWAACGLQSTAAGNYVFTINCSSSDGFLYLKAHFPAAVNDFQVMYYDNAAWSGSSHASTWRHPSRIIEARAGGVDTISFFVAKNNSPTLYAHYAYSINAGTGAITWKALNIAGASSKSLTVDSSAVWNFKVTQSTAGVIYSIENIGAYTGDYYIRCDAMNSKWDFYRSDLDHKMTYSAFSESAANSFGEKFSHYKAKWCPRGTNVKFVIANDYSPCISDTLIRDVNKSWPENMDVYGKLNSDGSADVTKDKWSANIRFMWNRHTNKISRAYVASATNVTRKFLVLRGCDAKIHDHNNNAIPATTYLAANEVLLEDDQNWIYETTIKVQPEARVKLYACYGEDPASVPNAQYFRGKYDSNNCGSDDNSIQILGGTGSKYYLMRVIYDFKTNRLITAWLPDGTAVDQAPLNIDADVMVIRDHQQGAEAITFTTNTKSLGQVKTVYGTMRFNRWTLSNRYRMSDTNNPTDPSKWSTTETDINKDHCKDASTISRYHAPLPTNLQTSSFERNNYFISFPFDVQLSEVFGFGTYGTHWIISKYNGLRRAQVGYFRDNCINGDFDCTNWDYIWDRTGVTLKAYEGYLLSLDLDLMQYDDTTNFWLNQIHQVELYFPSKVPMSTITTTNVTLPGMTDDYLCTKNYNKDGTNPEGDRRVKDSYWRCIGVPSYAPYGTVLKTGETEIQWNTDYTWYEDQRSFPFLYEWNTTDNTLTPQRTKTFNFKPLHSYLVQNKNTITWTAVSATPSSIVRRQRTEAQQEYTWRLNLTGDDNDESDTYIRMTDDEEVTEGFDFGPDMIKKLRDGYIVDANGDPIWDSSIDDYKQGVLHSDIYSILGYEYLAANSLPLNTTSTTIIPIGVRLKKAGEFTLSMPDGTYGVSITLVDNNTGARTELGAGFTYSFESEAGQYDDRFYLEIAKIKDIATGTEEIGEPSKSDVRKVMINGILYIVRGDQIFDALGNRVE